MFLQKKVQLEPSDVDIGVGANGFPAKTSVPAQGKNLELTFIIFLQQQYLP